MQSAVCGVLAYGKTQKLCAKLVKNVSKNDQHNEPNLCAQLLFLLGLGKKFVLLYVNLVQKHIL